MSGKSAKRSGRPKWRNTPSGQCGSPACRWSVRNGRPVGYGSGLHGAMNG